MTTLNQEYELLTLLGAGGMGEVYQARHLATGHLVALKVLATRRGGTEEGTILAIRREVEAIARMHHPKIVSIYDVGTVETAPEEPHWEGRPFFVMELAKGGSLDVKAIRSFADARAVLLQILDGLAHAHARGVLHRDLKPDNVLNANRPDQPPDLRLTDFGIAFALPSTGHQLASERELSRRPAGTALYMAPEQAQGAWRDWGPWTDLYALGCVAYEILYGRPPFEGKTAFAILEQHLSRAPQRLTPRFAVPLAFEDWIDALLQKDPYARVSRAASAARRLLWIDAVQIRTLPIGALQIEALKTDLYGPTLAAEPLLRTDPPQESTIARDDTIDLEAMETLTFETLSLGKEAATELLTLRFDAFKPREPKDSEVQVHTLLQTLPHAPQNTEDLASNAATKTEKRAKKNGPPGKQKTVQFPDWRKGLIPLSPERELLGLSLHGVREIPFIGHEEKRDLLWQQLQKAYTTGEPHAVILSGAGGTGISAFARWAMERVHELGMGSTLSAYHSPGADNTLAISAMVARLIGCLELDEEGLQKRIETFVARFGDPEFSDLDEARLTSFVGPTALARKQSGHRLSQVENFLTSDRLLHYLCRLGPVLMMIDEAQWGEDSLLYVRHLMDLTRGHYPLVLIITVNDEILEARKEEHQVLSALRGHPRVLELALSELRDQEMEFFFDQVLTLQPALKRDMIASSKGSPLYGSLLLSHLIDQDLLLRTPRGYALKEEIFWPRSPNELWLLRVESLLKAEELQLLTLAAIFGFEIEKRVAELSQEFLGLSMSIPQFFARLSSQGLIRYLDSRPTFSQNSMRTALLDRLDRSPKKEEFYRIASQIALSLFEDTAENRYLESAGSFLEEIGAKEEATCLYVRAIQLYQEHTRSQPMVRLFSRLKALGVLYTLQQEAPPSAQQFDLERFLAWRHTTFRDLDGLEKSVERLKEIATRGFPEAKDHALAVEAMRLVVEGSIQAATAILQEVARTTTNPWLTRRVFERLSWCLELSGHLEEAAQTSARAIELVEDIPRNQTILGWNFTRNARLLGRLGRFEEAQKDLDKALKRFERTGSVAGLADVANTAGELARIQKDFEAAEVAYLKAFRLYELGGQYYPVVEMVNLCFVRIHRDAPEEIEPKTLERLRKACIENHTELYLILVDLIAAWRALRLQNFSDFEHYWTEAHREESELVESDLLMLYEEITALLHKEGHKELARQAEEKAYRVRQALH